MTFSGPPQDVTFEHKYKHISVVIFSVLVHQMCVSDTKTWLLNILLVLAKRPKNVLKMSQSEIYFLMPSAYQTLQSEDKLKT